eukprot:1857947-Rhodomonas_salina.1
MEGVCGEGGRRDLAASEVGVAEARQLLSPPAHTQRPRTQTRPAQSQTAQTAQSTEHREQRKKERSEGRERREREERELSLIHISEPTRPRLI